MTGIDKNTQGQIRLINSNSSLNTSGQCMMLFTREMTGRSLEGEHWHRHPQSASELHHGQQSSGLSACHQSPHHKHCEKNWL